MLLAGVSETCDSRTFAVVARAPPSKSLVSTLASAGRHGEARRRYRLYTERMRQNNREPAPYPA